jgi:hypothetical protein
MSVSPTYKGFPSSIFDHGAADGDRYVAEWQARHERWARAESWVQRNFSGMMFSSLDILQRVALNYYETVIGGAASDEHRDVINCACRNVWVGMSVVKTVAKMDASGRIQHVTIRAA